MEGVDTFQIREDCPTRKRERHKKARAVRSYIKYLNCMEERLDYSKVWDGAYAPDNETVGRIISRKLSKKEIAELTIKVGEACLKHENDSTCFPLIQTLLMELTRYIGEATPTRRDALMMLAGYTAGHFDEAMFEEDHEGMVKAIEEAKERLETIEDVKREWNILNGESNG